MANNNTQIDTYVKQFNLFYWCDGGFQRTILYVTKHAEISQQNKSNCT